jgi:hypothetical protein
MINVFKNIFVYIHQFNFNIDEYIELRSLALFPVSYSESSYPRFNYLVDQIIS